MHINLAVGYGGRAEITHAVRRLVDSHREAGGNLEDLAKSISVDAIAKHLDTVGQPDPDLVIRTSGEQRLSDFMLWQSAHSEFYFLEALGPDLREIDFLRALRDFGRRQRRYGH
jgi:short-chain Z-isoprenyl diphosphate synthase